MKRHVGKFEDLKEVVNFSRNETVYKCPYCDIVSDRGPDTIGKFYFNLKKGKGHCFRCETVVFYEGMMPLEWILEDLNPNYTEEDLYSSQFLNINGWSTSIIDNAACLQYMNSRGISIETLNRFDVRATNVPHQGVVFINKTINSKHTDFYQIRNLDAWCKHATLKDLVKPCCWLEKAEGDLVLCEGFSDGLACFEHSNGQLHPVPLTGKSLTDTQLNQLVIYIQQYYKRVKNIYICMDGGFFESSIRIARSLYPKLSKCIVRVVPMPWDTDPNELSGQEFMECITNAQLYAPFWERRIRDKIYGRK